MPQHERSPGPDSHESSPISPVSATDFDAEDDSDKSSVATTAPETVMAEQVTSHVVKEAQSVGRPAPIDDTATTNTSAHGELAPGPATANATEVMRQTHSTCRATY
jgi:hypothetical protein